MSTQNDPENPSNPILPRYDFKPVMMELFNCLQENNRLEIKKLVDSNPEILNFQYHNYDYLTIFHLACNDQFLKNVTEDTIDLLITLGANYCEPSKQDHWEPIHYTAMNCNKEKMEVLLQKLTTQELNSVVCVSRNHLQNFPFCSNREIEKTYSNNALHLLLKFCSRNENFYECCKLLIEKKIDVNHPDSMGVTPLQLITNLNDPRFADLRITRTDSLSPLNNIEEYVVDSRTANACDNGLEQFSSCTLLQLCCENGSIECVMHLLAKQANINKTIDKNPQHPMILAMLNDHEEIVQLFLERQDLVLPSSALLETQLLNVQNDSATSVKYVNLLLKHFKTSGKDCSCYLSYTDEFNRTALYYAIHHRCTSTILTYLSLGASLITRDVFGYTPLDLIDARDLEVFFDKAITKSQHNSPHDFVLTPTRANFTVKIDYRNVVEIGEEIHSENDFLDRIITCSNLKYLVNHPFVATFLTLKWNKCKFWVYFNLTLYCLTYFSYILDFLFLSKKERKSNLLLWFSYIPLFLRVLAQVSVLRLRYFRRVESYFDFALIGAITYVILATWVPRFDDQNVLVACSIVFLTSTLGIFTQLGNLSYFTVKVTMVKQISINFFKTMTFYLFPVMAFLLSFYMLSETHTLNNFCLNVFGLIVMYAENPDEDLLEQFKTNPIFGHVIYLVAVIVIGVILHNLLIGLAVSDLQNVEFISKLEQAKYVVKIENIICYKYKKCYFSTMLFKRIFNFLKIFKDNQFLIVRYYNTHKMDVVQNNSILAKIKDKNIAAKLNTIYEKSFLKDLGEKDQYNIKNLYEKLDRIEKLLTRSQSSEIIGVYRRSTNTT